MRAAFLRSTAILSLLYAAAGLASRATFRSTETRWQAAAFCAAAFAGEAAWAAVRRGRPRWARALACAAAASVAIVATKYRLEPQARAKAAVVARDAARAVVR